MSKNWRCPNCKERVTLLEYWGKGHLSGNCPLTKSQREQLGIEEE